jgi:hypothetical protein
MKPSKTQIKAIKTAVNEGPDRSPLFNWMVKNHSAMIAKYGSGRMPWKSLCEIFVELSLVDGKGKPPTEIRASRTWREACAEVARRASVAKSAPSTQRSPRKNEWRPPVAEPKSDLRNFTTETQQRARQAAVLFREEPMPSRVARPAPVQNKEVDDDDLTPEQQAKIDRVKEEFRQAALRRSGNLY